MFLALFNLTISSYLADNIDICLNIYAYLFNFLFFRVISSLFIGFPLIIGLHNFSEENLVNTMRLCCYSDTAVSNKV